ncbi:acyltransferase [Amycolatopsis sp. NBC_01488]|uniref:acyltransferase family protein n=1 Tax=Amycolatopsis sp. NBC_01488 TaxID=2903563 RepID=UPI002E2AC46A|nr:acyltransferase [Amycolatopsis sp. NBC_01488]
MSATLPLVDVKSSNTRRQDLPALTGLRFVAALLVFFTHVSKPQNPGNPHLAAPFRDANLVTFLGDNGFRTGIVAVSCFFLLSGFVITWSAKPDQRLSAYWRRRVVKVFPSHFVTWALCMLLFAGVFTTNHGILNLFFIDTWFTDPSYWGGANGPAWSLNGEMLFYVVFPLMVIPIRRIPERKLWLWAGIVLAALVVATVLSQAFLPDTPPWQNTSIPKFWFVYFFPPMRLFEFAIGMIVARIVISGRWPRIPLSLVGVLAVGGLLLALVVPYPFNITLVMLIPLVLTIGSLASANLRGNRTILGTRPMVWLGKVSFGFFMTQAIVVFWFRPAVFGATEYGTAGGILLIAALFAVNLAFGWVLHKFVELPAMKYWGSSKKRVAGNAPRTEEPDKVPAL